MKLVLPVLVTAILCGCADYRITPDSKIEALRKSTGITWELMEIRNLTGEWRMVTDSEKHFLTFINDSTVEYANAELGCTGQFFFESLENSIISERLILKVPCMVPAPQLWWEHLIEAQAEDEVVTYPLLSPTAYMTYERFKYKIIYKSEQ